MINRTKRSLIKDIKTLKANRKRLSEFTKEKYVDDNGNANIHLYVNEASLYNPLTNPNEPDLSNEILEHIENEALYIPVEYPLNLSIHTKNEIDTNYVQERFKEHYWKKLAIKRNELKTNMMISIILLILGIILLSVYLFLELRDGSNILFTEIFSIIGSFAIWEAADYALLNRNALRIEQLKIAQLSLLKVNVIKEEK